MMSDLIMRDKFVDLIKEKQLRLACCESREHQSMSPRPVEKVSENRKNDWVRLVRKRARVIRTQTASKKDSSTLRSKFVFVCRPLPTKNFEGKPGLPWQAGR
jgi:hypothetical protein